MAFRVKLLKDLCGKPVWGCLHLEHYFASHTPEEANELISQVFRAGGTGCKHWLIDWFGITGWDQFGSRSRFEEIMNCLKHAGAMRALRFPEPDAAILFSNDSEYTRRWGDRYPNPGSEAAFTFLGPRARGWFQFVSDCQIEDRKIDLAKYRAVYVPWAPYASDGVANALAAYARRGGLLVVGDTDTLRSRLDGTRRPWRREVLGVECGEPGDAPAGAWQAASEALEGLGADAKLAPLRTRYTPIKPGEDAKPLLTFGDGSPAAMVRRLGKGRVVAFAQSPFTFPPTRDPGWQRFFAALHRSAGGKVGHDIWRFRFPLSQRAHELAYGDPFPGCPKGSICLTGNCARWRLDAPVHGPNAKPVGTIRYSRAPDGLPESRPGSSVPVAQSDLTDRIPSLSAKPLHHLKFKGSPMERERQTRAALAEWAVSYVSREAVDIDLDFGRKVRVTQVALFLGGEAPAVEVFRLEEAGAASLIAGVSRQGVLDDEVRPVRIDLPSVPLQRLRIRLGDRVEREMYVSELEVWGRDAK